MPTTNPVPSNDPTDLLFNAQKLDQVVNGSDQYYTDRLGVNRRTVEGISAAADVVLGGLGYAPPVTYASGISMTLTTQTVEYSGEIYAPKVASLPFTTSTWPTDSAKFRLIQGVAATDLAASGGAGMIGYMPEGTGAVATTVQAKLRESVSVFDFMTAAQIADVKSGAATLDVTSDIQAAIDYAESEKCSVLLPAGAYKITSTLTINEEVGLFGEGSQQSNIVLYTSSASTPAILVDIQDNSSFIGGSIGGLGIRCNGGSARGIGLRIQTTATNSAVSNSVFHDLYITHVNVGVSMAGVIYMNTFRNITVSGNVDSYGWYATTAQEIIYNSYEDLEVTNVNNGAWAYYFAPAVASQFRNLTADGCCYFAGAYTRVQGLSVEGIFATITPSPAAVVVDQIACLTDVAMINIPNSKCSQGINATATHMEISNVLFPDAGEGNQPNTPVIWQSGGTGVLSNVRMNRAPVNTLESAMPTSALSGFLIFCCQTITNKNLTYYEGVWTPGFSTWATAPSVSSAKYVRVGHIVTVFLNFNGGSCVDYSTITGLPFTADSAVGGTATMASGDVAKRFTAQIPAGTSSITGLPAQTLTGVFCQLTATYHAA